jgi:hypothetical protein
MTDRAKVEEIYGFPFPDDLVAFHELVARAPEVCRALEIDVDGPLAILAGDAPRPGWDPGGDWPRFYKDPPEFFTVLTGSSDGLHWGYWFDAPGELPPVVAHYFHSDGCQLSSDGSTLFDGLRLHLEQLHRDALSYMEDDPESADDYRRRLESYAVIRDKIGEVAPFKRPETGEEYCVRYLGGERSSERHPVASTRNGMGIVLPHPGDYEPLPGDEFKTFGWEPTPEELARMTARARELAEGDRAGAALKLGHDLWSIPEFRNESSAMLDLAYATLGRQVLRDYLRRAVEFRRRCDAAPS